MTVTRSPSISILLKLWLCSRTRVEVAVPAWIDKRRPCPCDEIAGAMDRCVVIVTSEEHVHSGIGDRIERQLAAPDGAGHGVADLQRKKRMVRNQDPHCVRIGSGECLSNEPHLVFVDPPVLEGERSRRVDAEDRRSRDFLHRAQRIVDVAHVARQW